MEKEDMVIRLDKKGKLTIPKKIRDELNLKHKTEFDITYFGKKLSIKPEKECSFCGKPLPIELYERGSCIECPVPEKMIIY